MNQPAAPTTAPLELVLSAAENATRSARLVAKRFSRHPDSPVDHAAIKDLEHRGDELTREIVEALRVSGVEHADLDDLYFLATGIDDAVDAMDSASEMLDLYRVEAAMEQALEQCDILCRATEHLHQAIAALAQGGDPDPHLAAVSELEDEGDRRLRHGMAALFEHEGTNPRTIIQWKDIFEALEESLDACATSCHRVSNMLLRR